jgi:hypothetical protein
MPNSPLSAGSGVDLNYDRNEAGPSDGIAPMILSGDPLAIALMASARRSTAP